MNSIQIDKSGIAKIISLTALALLVTVGCRQNPIREETQRGVIADSAMVVSARVEASRIGVEVLRSGGNAFDAMIATDLALVVAYPFAGNIGGGGFMVFRTSDGEVAVSKCFHVSCCVRGLQRVTGGSWRQGRACVGVTHLNTLGVSASGAWSLGDAA